jgi:single-strand DNA-binding protein
MSLNVWTFTGRLGRDAEQKHLPNGTAVTEFTVAVDVGFGDKKTTLWPRCAMFGDRGAKVAQYLIKGQQVGVSGSVNMREWTNKDSETKTSLEVRVSELDLIGSKGDGDPRQAPQAERPRAQSAPEKKKPTFNDMDDDIPF